jgi:uncharacterized iron-regulated membrane protein
MNDSIALNRAALSLSARRRSALWRIHFWAALIASPFVMIAALTGLLYIFTPQIEAHLYGHLEHVTPSGPMLALDASVAAARNAAPSGYQIETVVPPATPQDAVQVTFARPSHDMGEHAGHGQPAAAPATVATAATAATAAASTPPVADKRKCTVFVDPYHAWVLGSQLEQGRFSEWARRLHSRLLQGESLRWMIELAASWLLVMLLTGIVLWWPQPGQPGLPRAGARGRQGWRQWHAFLGVLLSILSLAMVLTGITWSKYAGNEVRALRDWTGQAPQQVPSHLHSMPQDRPQLDFQQAWDRTRALVPGVPVQLTPPRGPHGFWRAGAADRMHPTSRFDLVLNAYNGQVLYYGGWDKQTAFGKATAVGIPFHRGELGIWNQVLLFVFAAGVLFSLVSGWVMFFKRRRTGLSRLPRLLPGAWRSLPLAAMLLGLALCALMPLLAISSVALVVVEVLLDRRCTNDRTAAA